MSAKGKAAGKAKEKTKGPSPKAKTAATEKTWEVTACPGHESAVGKKIEAHTESEARAELRESLSLKKLPANTAIQDVGKAEPSAKSAEEE